MFVLLINDSNSSGHILSKPGGNKGEQVLEGPSISENGPSIFEKCRDPRKTANFGGKKLFLVSEKKIFQSGNGCAMCFLQKKWKNSVKFGLSSRSNISLPRIGGHHPVPSLSILSTERLGTAMYYPNHHPLFKTEAGNHWSGTPTTLKVSWGTLPGDHQLGEGKSELFSCGIF